MLDEGLSLLDAFKSLATSDELATINVALDEGAFYPQIIIPGDLEAYRLLELRWSAQRALRAIAERLIASAPRVRGILVATGRDERVPLRLLLRVEEINWVTSELQVHADDGKLLIHFLEVRVTLRKPKAPHQSNDRKLKPEQKEVNAWLIAHYQDAYDRGQARPKREESAFPACRDAISATFEQMKEAMRHLPKNLKRGSGCRDR
jgi:hypothetical protein